MRTTILSIVSSAAAIISTLPAMADDVAPNWNVNAVCANAKSSADCLRVENQNRYSLLNRWSAFPAADRSACEPGAKSYERLLNCLDDRAMKAMESPEPPKPSDASHNG